MEARQKEVEARIQAEKLKEAQRKAMEEAKAEEAKKMKGSGKGVGTGKGMEKGKATADTQKPKTATANDAKKLRPIPPPPPLSSLMDPQPSESELANYYHLGHFTPDRSMLKVGFTYDLTRALCATTRPDVLSILAI